MGIYSKLLSKDYTNVISLTNGLLVFTVRLMSFYRYCVSLKTVMVCLNVKFVASFMTFQVPLNIYTMKKLSTVISNRRIYCWVGQTLGQTGYEYNLVICHAAYVLSIHCLGHVVVNETGKLR
jgi:hypothetical protein